MTTPELKWCFLGADAARVAGGRAGMQTSAKAVLFSLFLSRSRCLFSFPSSLSLPLIDKDKANLFGNQGHGWCRQTLLLHSPPRSRPPSPFFLPPQRFVFFDSIAAAAPERSGVRCRRSGSAEPHSCHTPAPLQCISSSRGHASASAVITAGILIIISNAGMYISCKS